MPVSDSYSYLIILTFIVVWVPYSLYRFRTLETMILNLVDMVNRRRDGSVNRTVVDHTDTGAKLRWLDGKKTNYKLMNTMLGEEE